VSILLRVIGGLLFLGAVGYGVDQRQKRKREQAANRARLRRDEARLAGMEQDLRWLRERLRVGDRRLREAYAEIVELRASISQRSRAA
jgi:hypothetical protein